MGPKHVGLQGTVFESLETKYKNSIIICIFS